MGQHNNGHWSRSAVLGALLGVAIGVVDTIFLVLLGVEMRVGEIGVTPWVGGFFTLSFAVFGYSVGRLIEVRRLLKANSELIASQFEELKLSQTRLVQSEKMASLGRLTAGVAHEVRNPLGVIRASVSMIMDDLPNKSDAYQAGEFIREEVDRLNAFVTALMDFSRPVKPRLSDVDLLGVVRGAQLLASVRAAEADVSFSFDDDETLPYVKADSDLLIQVVLGLMLNAVQILEETELEERCVVVRCYCAEEGTVVLEVADNGPGIDADDRERVFEPFFTTRTDGTGLGLAMAKRVLDVHGGQIEVVLKRGVGDAGQGACLRMTLPRWEGEA